MSASVVDVLDGQHRRLGELFELVASPDEDRPARLRDLMREMAAHIEAERRVLQDVDDEALSEDFDRMEHLMVLIERRKFNSPDVPDLVNELKEVSEAHVRAVEATVVPQLNGLAPEEQERLGRQVEEELTEVASHPHPHLHSGGPISSVLAGAAGKWDSLRDRTVNNRHPEASSEGP